jgi:anaerobic nitric oxide reductase flavorubredoxin
VKDGETISLGKHTLQFFSTPNVHWPETMMTYEQEEKILFSCDAFGGFCALDVSIFDDGVEDLNLYEKEALRYFTNIVANRSKSVLNAIQKLTNLPIAIVAPSHGLIWRKKPEHIIQLYKQWSEMAFQPGDLGVTILYGSMYGGTEQLAEVIGNGLNKEGVPFIIFDIARTHISYILPSLWTKRGVLIGAPTYEGGLFPPIAAALQMAKHKKVSGKTTGYFGGFGWGGGAKNEFDLLVKELGWQPAGVLEFIGSPSEEDLQKGERFGSDFAKILLGSTL